MSSPFVILRKNPLSDHCIAAAYPLTRFSSLYGGPWAARPTETLRRKAVRSPKRQDGSSCPTETPRRKSSVHRKKQPNKPQHTKKARLTACLFGAFCPFRLDGRQPACTSKKQKSLENSSLTGARQFCRSSKCGQTRKDPKRILAVLSRGLTQYGRISARQNRVCPCQPMVLLYNR